MTEFEITHGLSQDHPGPLEPVEVAKVPTTPVAGGWLPIESAPKTGRTLLLGSWNSHGKWRTVRGQWMSAEYIAEHWEEPDDVEEGWFETAVEAEEAPNCWRITPSHWQPLPAAPGVSTVEDARAEQVTAILWAIMRDAQAAKEPCGDDPESAAAIRNGKLATIAGAAAQALGLVRGPDYPAPAAGDALDAHFDLWQDDMVVASASGPRSQALDEIQHYAAVYGQDGPVQIEEVIRIPLSDALAAQRKGDA